jgi:hypothetical protein
MDPQATLDLIRELVKEISKNEDDQTDEAVELAEAVDDLDNWLMKGGFLPEDWENAEKGS